VPVFAVSHIQVFIPQTHSKTDSEACCHVGCDTTQSYSHLFRYCRQHFPLKRQHTPNQPHGVTPQHRILICTKTGQVQSVHVRIISPPQAADGGNKPQLRSLPSSLSVLTSRTSDNGSPPSMGFMCRTTKPWLLENSIKLH
jgi:hypothetical protein